MGDYNDSIANNFLLESIDNNIPLAIDVSTSCKKSQNPNKKKQTPPTSPKWKVILSYFSSLKKIVIKVILTNT